MDRKKVARILEEIGALLEIRGESPFKSRAYHNAARAIVRSNEDVVELARTGRLREIRGIGPAIERSITELVSTGELPYHTELRGSLPPGFLEMLEVPGLGGKKLQLLYEKLGVGNIGELEYACKENRLLKLPGFGAKTQAKILQGIEQARSRRGEHLLPSAWREAEGLLKRLGSSPASGKLLLAGSLRRRRETVGSIDVVATSKNAAALVRAFTAEPLVQSVHSEGPDRAEVSLATGIAARLRVASEEELPFVLLDATGSDEHTEAMRNRARKLGLRLETTGLFRGAKRIACRSESEIYEALGLEEIPPELREGIGEIEAAAKRALPRLVDRGDLRGVVHVHTTYSDGVGTVAEMVGAAAALGFEYIGITDHSQSAFYAHGLKVADLERQRVEIDSARKRFPTIRVLHGIESDILADGGLDYAPEILDAFDFVIASIHSRFKMDEAEMTARIVRAIEDPHTTILGHPTGRLLLARASYAVDLERIIDAAIAHGVAVEINAHPNRLELDWRIGRRAAEKGAMLSIDPDAHNASGLADVDWGVSIARKSWLPPEQILNARDADGFLGFARARRAR